MECHASKDHGRHQQSDPEKRAGDDEHEGRWRFKVRVENVDETHEAYYGKNPEEDLQTHHNVSFRYALMI
jgi:hypothetical protein